VTRFRTLAAAALLGTALLAGGCVGLPAPEGEEGTPADGAATPTESTPSPPPAAHRGLDQTTVTVLESDSGEELGSVETAVADNRSLRYTGLGETGSLPADRGMLFVFDRERDLTFVMRNMSFGIDIVYVAANGTITAIHHAEEPGPGEDGESQGYPGRGQYVLEVNFEWTTERGVEVGDRVEFELPE
jgi:uncharacterized membrane protein (UPF0127 family)